MKLQPGTVYLVGAGPGDPGLLTVKASKLLKAADVVCYDSLVGDEIIEAIPADTECINVGKRPGPEGKRTTQTDINRLLVDYATANHKVVRLKGGDPTIFGRGGEEAVYLARHHIPHEIVPGVTSAIAGPNCHGIPLTHREIASSLTIITGHEAREKDESALDWAAISNILRTGGTLVVLMGVQSLPTIVKKLREEEISSDLPAAMIERATLPGETIIVDTLDTIVAAAQESDISPPAVTVFGEVVSMHFSVAYRNEPSAIARVATAVSHNQAIITNVLEEGEY